MIGLPLSTIFPTTVLEYCAKEKEKEKKQVIELPFIFKLGVQIVFSKKLKKKFSRTNIGNISKTTTLQRQ